MIIHDFMRQRSYQKHYLLWFKIRFLLGFRPSGQFFEQFTHVTVIVPPRCTKTPGSSSLPRWRWTFPPATPLSQEKSENPHLLTVFSARREWWMVPLLYRTCGKKTWSMAGLGGLLVCIVRSQGCKGTSLRDTWIHTYRLFTKKVRGSTSLWTNLCRDFRNQLSGEPYAPPTWKSTMWGSLTFWITSRIKATRPLWR